MRFLDEKELWNSEVEDVAEKLANKSKVEIIDILYEQDVIRLRSTTRPKNNLFNRLMFIILVIPLFILCGIKWCFTGNMYLDSWEKRYKILALVIKIIGVRNE
jgi:hypothetical protein